MPGYIQNPYMPQYGGFQYGNYPMQPNAPYQTPTTYPTFNPQPQTISNSADALAKSDISGKIVDTENDISVNDIPMDGKVHLFILKDYSKVIGKAWTADGKIATSCVRARFRHSRLQIRLHPCIPVAATITSLSDSTSGGIL